VLFFVFRFIFKFLCVIALTQWTVTLDRLIIPFSRRLGLEFTIPAQGNDYWVGFGLVI
jgi:hypothetical protein